MRKTLFTFLLIQLSLFSYSQYCTSYGNTKNNKSTTRVIFNTINNSSGKPSGYNNYTPISTVVNTSLSYNITVQINTDGSSTCHSMVWIDWNKNNNFSDVGEQYDLGTATNVFNQATSNSPLLITVPANASAGNTRMRVVTKNSTAPSFCDTNFDGEVEDYTINILATTPIPTTNNTSVENGNKNLYNDSTIINIDNTITLSSALNTDKQTLCENNPITDITYNTTGATGAFYSGLPTGVSGSWANNVATISGVPTQSGTFNYTINLTGGSGTVSTIGTITVNTTPVFFSIPVTDVTVCSAPYNGIIEVFPNGYQYSYDGGSFVGINHVDTLSAGNHIVTLQDNNGCTVDSIVTVNSNTGISIDSIIYSPLLCNGYSTEITVFDTDATQYSIDNGSSYQTDSNFTNVVAGTYTVMIKDNSGCQALENITITEPDSISTNYTYTNVICTTLGSIISNSSGGTGSLSYLWSNGDTTASINNLVADTYTLIVTDENACTNYDTITIQKVGSISSNIDVVQDNLCINNGDGEVLAWVSNTINLPLFFEWSTGYTISVSDTLMSVTNLVAGIYSVTITDIYGCTDSSTATVNLLDTLSLTVSSNNISCYGKNNGNASVLVTNAAFPYNILWSNTAITDSINNLSEGNYFATITDNNNCIATTSVNIQQPDSFSFNTNVYYQNNLGNISVETSGGTPEYAYNWSNSGSTNTIIDLQVGYYFVAISDANNCVDTLYFNISEIEGIVIPTVFTPNGDGINDTWNIKNIKNIETLEIYIFNRWGNNVYSSTTTGTNYADITKQWNGNYKGRELPLGTYVYILIADNKEYNGSITIVR